MKTVRKDCLFRVCYYQGNQPQSLVFGKDPKAGRDMGGLYHGKRERLQKLHE
jgi:hypothetical protein